MSAKPYQMHWERIEENWDIFKPQAKEKWRELTDRDLDETGGKRDRMMEKLRETYGLTEKEADAELTEFSLPENVI